MNLSFTEVLSDLLVNLSLNEREMWPNSLRMVRCWFGACTCRRSTCRSVKLMRPIVTITTILNITGSRLKNSPNFRWFTQWQSEKQWQFRITAALLDLGCKIEISYSRQKCFYISVCWSFVVFWHRVRTNAHALMTHWATSSPCPAVMLELQLN